MTHAELTEAVRGSLLADEQRDHCHDAPARTHKPETCACTHAAGDHRTAGGHGLHPPVRGVCLVTGCGCAGFQTARTVPGTPRIS